MKAALLAALLALPLPALGQETAAFLKIGVGARALGMGNAYTAVADDVSAMAWNPAGLARISRPELGATHAELTTDTRYDFVGFAQPTKLGTFGAAANYLSQGTIEGRDVNGAPAAGYTASDEAVNLSFASRMTSALGLGANVKYIRSSIADASAQSYALDLGGQYCPLAIRPGPGLPCWAWRSRTWGPG